MSAKSIKRDVGGLKTETLGGLFDARRKRDDEEDDLALKGVNEVDEKKLLDVASKRLVAEARPISAFELRLSSAERRLSSDE